MFLLSKLEDRSTRFAQDVHTAREFLLDRGIPATSLDALPHLCARLRTDPSFQRDVTSLIRGVIRRENEAVDYMDLLAILVVAATGENRSSPTDADEESVREILRFLTHIPSDASPKDATHLATASAPLQRVPPVVARPSSPVETRLPVLTHASDESAIPPISTPPRSSLAEAPDTSWWRGRAVWIVAIVALSVGLGSGWLVRHERSLERSAAESPNSPAPIISTQSNAVHALPTPVGGARKPESLVVRKNSPGFSRRSSNRATATRPAVAEQMSRARVPVNSDSIRDTPAAPSPRKPAAPAIGAISPRENPLPVAPESPANEQAPNYTAPVATAGVRRRLPKVVVINPGPSRRATSTFGSPDSATQGVVRPGSAGMMASNLISSPAPAYPAAALQAHVQGEVTVQAVVDRDGNVMDARVVSGPELLRSATLEAVQHWRYRPYRQGGEVIEVATTAIVDFELP